MDQNIDIIVKLQKNSSNDKCADCEEYNCITRCSVNNGVFLCKDCAALHQEYLQLEVSDIRILPVIKDKPVENDDRMDYMREIMMDQDEQA